MALRRRRSHYQQLTEFERGHVVRLREGGFSFRDIAERLAGIYPLYMIVGNSGQEKVLPQEDRVPGGHVALMRGKPLCLAYGCGAFYCVCGRNWRCSWHHSDTTNCFKSVILRTAPSQTPCSVNSTDSKPLTFAT
ncbi:hypothetical protein AVEN_231573-1 [Araneus ventricosus]|uniref:Transposase IS30-like HTH domain-containing protein n=1 Tax=Araneus ventricosus TaxID=182803 RepID=A0A4Y2IJE6_ARAVE|nr:hypothetical protein AVEN_231573-1 [Araneus ventricosus]